MSLERDDSGNAITGYAAGEVRLRGRVFRSSLAVSRDALVEDWRPGPVATLGLADLEPLLRLEPQILILGTGARQQLPPPALFAELAARGIGLEVMDNGAACRTFNLLLSEQREVVVALLL